MINAVTNSQYQGANADLCMRAMDAFNFNSDRFATFKQWRQLNRTVKRGEKGLRLVKYVEKTITLPSGQVTKKMLPVSFSVFNIEQTQAIN